MKPAHLEIFLADICGLIFSSVNNIMESSVI